MDLLLSQMLHHSSGPACPCISHLYITYTCAVPYAASLQHSDAVLTREGLNGQSQGKPLTSLTSSYLPVLDHGKGNSLAGTA